MRPLHAPIDGARAQRQNLLGILPYLDAFGGVETGFEVRSVVRPNLGSCLGMFE